MTVLQYKLEVEICADGEGANKFWFSEGNESVAINQSRRQ